MAATCGMSVRNNTREHQAGVEDFAGRKKRNKTKNRRARRETKQELEKLINAAIEEWIWSQRGQKREALLNQGMKSNFAYIWKPV